MFIKILMAFFVSSSVLANELKFKEPTRKDVLENDMIFAAGSMIDIKEKSLKMLNGNVWIKDAKKLKIETVYGDVVIDGKNAFVSLNFEKDQMFVRLGNSRALIKSRLGEIIPLTSGEEIWLGAMVRDGTQSHGVPAPVQWAWFVREWGQEFPFKAQIEAAIHEIRGISPDRVAASSEASVHVIERRIAAQKEREAEALAKRRAKDNERNAVRKQFFDRVFFR